MRTRLGKDQRYAQPYYLLIKRRSGDRVFRFKTVGEALDAESVYLRGGWTRFLDWLHARR